MKQEEIEMELWEYIDGLCNKADHERIATLIATDAIWLQHYNELIALHALIPKELEIEQPSMRFTKNVMEAVATIKIAPATKKYINHTVIKGIAAFFIITIVASVIYAFAITDWHSGNNDAYTNAFAKMDLSAFFNSNFFYVTLGINLVLGLLLTDTLFRRILRNSRS